MLGRRGVFIGLAAKRRPIGKLFRARLVRPFYLVPKRARSTSWAVAGVVPTGKYRSFSEEPALFAYFPLAFAPSPALYVHVRPTTNRAVADAALRAAVSSLDPHVPLINLTTLDVAMGQSLFLQRAAATFIGAFALMALLLSATGI